MQTKKDHWLQEFLELEAASGILLIVAMVLALLFANTPLSYAYTSLLEMPVGVQVGPLVLNKAFILWVNDGLMAVFFLLIGLEVKREILQGQLSNPATLILPGVAALGGMVVPVGIYIALNSGDPVAMQGWATPAATDIAFALGVLSLFGRRVPVFLKLFLMALAIIDDLGAIIIIAIFHTTDLSLSSLLLAGVAILVLVLLNLMGVLRVAAYMLVGLVLWISVLKSGVHATLAGVALAFTIPLRTRKGGGEPPLLHLEHALHPWVAFGILPLFAFANAGVSLHGFSASQLLDPVPLGTAAGLFLGKQVGVFGFSWLLIKSGFARLPKRITWLQFYGVAVLTGIGFTMSLFIATLAFVEHEGGGYAASAQIGVLVSSLLSASVGYAVLSRGLPALRAPKGSPKAQAIR